MSKSATPLRGIPFLAVALLAPPAARAESVRTVKLELSGSDASRFAVENLVGTLKVSSGPGSAVEIVATVYAETDELAAAGWELARDGARLVL